MTISSTDAISGERRLAVSALQRRAIGIVGRGDQALVFASRSSSPSGRCRRETAGSTSGTAAHRRDRRLGRRERAVGRRAPRSRRLPPPTALLVMPVVVLDRELAVHHRHAPVAPAAEPLGDLPAVAEIAHRVAELQRVGAVEPGVAGRAGRGQHALADAVDNCFCSSCVETANSSTRTPGRPSGVSLRRQHALDRRLAAAADHRGGEAGHASRPPAAPSARSAP